MRPPIAPRPTTATVVIAPSSPEENELRTPNPCGTQGWEVAMKRNVAVLLVVGLLGAGAPAEAQGRAKVVRGGRSRVLYVVRTADGCALSTDPGRSESATSCRPEGAQGYTTALGTNPMEMAALDGVPMELDVSQPVHAELFVTSAYLVGYVVAVGGGRAQVDVQLTASVHGKEVVVGEATESYLVTPAELDHHVDLTIEPDRSLAGARLDGLTMHVTVSGPTVLHGYVATNGSSRVTLPLAR